MEAVTQASLLEALRKALEAAPDDSGAMTTEELARAMGCSIETMRKRLKGFLRSGAAECVKVQRECIDGRTQKTAAYRLKEPSYKLAS